jgi:hypothetical protein
VPNLSAVNSWTGYLVGVALLAAVVAGLLFIIFVRPVEPRTAVGRITEKAFQEARTLTRVNAGPRREVWGTTNRRLPAAFVFTIRLEDGDAELRHWMERVAAEEFQIGDTVTVTYETRGIPGVWVKQYVRKMATHAPQ